MPAGRPVVAFDFDKTLTTEDTLQRFFREFVGTSGVVRAALKHLPSLVRASFGGLARDKAKAAMTRELLAGRLVEDANAAARATADWVLTKGLRDDTLAWLKWHRASGHSLIIVSASFEAYVRLVATELGVSELICTRWAQNGGVLTGELDGRNVRGAEKARRLSALLGSAVLEVAYGDSRGDREMLALARSPVWARKRIGPPPAG